MKDDHAASETDFASQHPSRESLDVQIFHGDEPEAIHERTRGLMVKVGALVLQMRLGALQQPDSRPAAFGCASFVWRRDADTAAPVVRRSAPIAGSRFDGGEEHVSSIRSRRNTNSTPHSLIARRRASHETISDDVEM
jgi:hypothetical protein